jgi:hypothetical protein
VENEIKQSGQPRSPARQKDIAPYLRETQAEAAQNIAIALAKTIPVVGWLVGLIGDVIPKQRLERFAQYVTNISRRVGDLEDKLASEAMLRPDRTALFEEGAAQAIKMIAPDRILVLAKIVAEGMTEDEERVALDRDYVRIFGELSDSDLQFLLLHRDDGDFSVPPRFMRLVSLGLFEQIGMSIGEKTAFNNSYQMSDFGKAAADEFAFGLNDTGSETIG